jgi:hypothetical protein
MSVTPADPTAEYATRRAAREATAADLGRRADRLGNARLAVFLAGLVFVYFVLWPRSVAPGWLLLPLVAFVGLAVRHDRVLKERDRALRAAAFWVAALRRLDGTSSWAGTSDTGAEFADDAHPYAPDLDLFGRGSLYELLSAARTAAGRATLADWLRAPAPSADEIRSRQAAVADLAPRLDLREDAAVLGEETARSKRRDDNTLTPWGEAPSAPLPANAAAVHAAAGVFGLLALAGLALWLTGRGSVWFGAAVVAGQLFAWRLAAGVKAAMAGVDRAGRELDLLARLLARIEAEPFAAPRLRALQETLAPAGGEPPSAAVRRLGTLLDWAEAPQNPFFAPLATLLLWRVHCALLIERWRHKNGARIRGWVESVGEFEALASLAGHAHAHPGDRFPEIADDREPPVYAAEGLAHPLLPEGVAVRNDLTLGRPDGGAPRLLLVSGSNMSGKSTLLRAVGTNAVLALAGAPVRARRLRLSRVQVGASLRTQDSLQGGVSRFLAEIRRLRQVAQLGETGDLPLLFLLDEILSGTNSHDRRIGAEGLARALLTRGRGDALGLITTHDLALTEMASDPALRAANVHLDDRVGDDGGIAFDYELRPGIVTRSNALALMRAVGLDV